MNITELPKLKENYDEEECRLTKNNCRNHLLIFIIYSILEIFIFSAVIMYDIRNS